MFQSKAKELIADEKGSLKEILVTCADKEVAIPAQMLLIAAGFSGAEEKIAETFGLSLNEKGRLGSEGHRTSNPKIFTAGDARLGATLVVTAIAEGRAAAKKVDEYLEGYTNL
jgi:glutamate synthase (NADPH/NADH) small chain